MKTNKKGFTLVELMTVVLLIAVLAAIALPIFTNHTRIAHAKKALDVLHMVHAAQERWAMDHNGAWTANLDNLDIEFPGGNVAYPGNVVNYRTFSITVSLSTSVPEDNYIGSVTNNVGLLMTPNSNIVKCTSNSGATGTKVCKGLGLD